MSDKQRALARGNHAGLDYCVLSNGLGYLCGYVRIPEGHPYYGNEECDLDVVVHGGITFTAYCEEDSPWGAGYWIGFDCAHCYDAPDPKEMDAEMLQSIKYMTDFEEAMNIGIPQRKIRSTGYVASECRNLAAQCASATLTGWACCHCESVMPDTEIRCLSCGAPKTRQSDVGDK